LDLTPGRSHPFTTGHHLSNQDGASACLGRVVRARAQETIQDGKPVSRVAGAVIVVIWLPLAVLYTVWIYEAFGAKS
jgi:hypothetical protein